MKVKRVNPEFKPIQLILESQEEVDAICTIVNSQQITKVFPILDDWYSQLDEYGDYNKKWNELVKIIQR